MAKSSIIEPKEKLQDIYPSVWRQSMNMDDTTILEYRNLAHFKYHMQNITQRDDRNCDISYKDALSDLVNNRSTMTQGNYDIIKNRVKNNLHKRGLIAEEVYESYRYDVEGDIVDVAKVAAGDPNCCLVPNSSYTNYFYEIYISVSYHYGITNKEVMENMAKILATIQLLEREHYYCKVSLIFPDRGCNDGSGKSNFLGIIPLFSHKDHKSIETMSSVLNDRLLRKFFFAVLEEQYGSDLASGYGRPIDLPGAIVPVGLDECELHSKIMEQIIQPCKKR